MSMGSRAPYAPARNEQAIRSNQKRSGDLPEFGTSSTAFINKKITAIQHGNQYNVLNVAREYRLAQENLVNHRADQDRQLSELTTARRSTLRGYAGHVRSGLRAAEQVYNMQK